MMTNTQDIPVLPAPSVDDREVGGHHHWGTPELPLPVVGSGSTLVFWENLEKFSPRARIDPELLRSMAENGLLPPGSPHKEK